jgi:hypothetical protein
MTSCTGSGNRSALAAWRSPKSKPLFCVLRGVKIRLNTLACLVFRVLRWITAEEGADLQNKKLNDVFTEIRLVAVAYLKPPSNL